MSISRRLLADFIQQIMLKLEVMCFNQNEFITSFVMVNSVCSLQKRKYMLFVTNIEIIWIQFFCYPLAGLLDQKGIAEK